jgi:cellulose synthase/poly-beta-1,6-N-acetylglucosamine synthase-like glycosyltransferase
LDYPKNEECTVFLALLLFFAFALIYMYILYPIILISIRQKKVSGLDFTDSPSVTIVVVAHNEEKVIAKTLDSLLGQDYPKELFHIVVTSDYSDDGTNDIVKSYKDKGVRLHETLERKGRANAHNEICETIITELIAYCDANTIWDIDSLKNLVSAFKDKSVGYATGQLKYINVKDNTVSGSEGIYWKYELLLRKLESKAGSITAGNGAIYAIRKECYEPIDIMYSHDLVFPSMVVHKGYRAIYVENALAYERAGETVSDEYARKIRMFGRAWHFLLRNTWVFNPFKVGALYSLFMISHRFLRYSAGLFQLLVLIFSLLATMEGSAIAQSMLLLQIIYYLTMILASTGKLGSNMYSLYYMNLFHLATLVGFFRAVTNKVKPFWLSPQTTRK